MVNLRRRLAPPLPLLFGGIEYKGAKVLGLFRKPVPTCDFAEHLKACSGELLAHDATRALALNSIFPASNSERDLGVWLLDIMILRGLTQSEIALYFKLYFHCTFQAALSVNPRHEVRQVLQAATSNFGVGDNYDFDATFERLDRIYNSQHIFVPSIQGLSNPAIKNSNAVLNAKFLLAYFIAPHANDKQPFIEKFDSFSATIGCSLGTAIRAAHDLSKRYRIRFN